MSDAVTSVLHLLVEYGGWRDPNPARSQVTALEHALQAATRAERAHAPDDLIIATLLHDAARPLSDAFHGEVMSWILRDKVSEDICLALYHHGTFQADIVHGTRNAERQFKDRSWYKIGRQLATWDSQSFDPLYESYPLSDFMPRLAKVLRR